MSSWEISDSDAEVLAALSDRDGDEADDALAQWRISGSENEAVQQPRRGGAKGRGKGWRKHIAGSHAARESEEECSDERVFKLSPLLRGHTHTQFESR